MFTRAIVKKYGDNLFRVVSMPLSFNNCNYKKFGWSSEEEAKLLNNVSRARSKIFEYSICNDFKYFVTLTIDPKYDRFDLKDFYKRTTQLIRDLRKKYHSDFKFLLVPELHKNGAYHMHGLFSGDFIYDFSYNNYNHLYWVSYEKFGFSSIQLIKNKEACSKYITKYITKEVCLVQKGKHCYFRSNNLDCAEVIVDSVVSSNVFNNYQPCFTSEFIYCYDFRDSSIVDKIKNNEYDNLLQ